MSKNKKRRTKRNRIMATIAENDPTRFRIRTVRPEKGKGRKKRPRRKDWNAEGVSFLYSCVKLLSSKMYSVTLNK